MFAGTTSFFDASGTEDITVLAVAGYASRTDLWLEFDGKWNGLIHDAGLEYFRITEFVHNSKQFAGWEDRRPEKAALFDDLTKLIHKYTDHVFGCVVPRDDYRRVNAIYTLDKTLRPYSLAGYDCIKRCHTWAISERRMPVISVFEQGDTHQDQLRQITKVELVDELRPIFVPKRVAPLQAADIAAWDLGNITTKVTQGADYKVWSKSLDRIRTVVREPDYGVYTYDDLVSYCVNAAITLRH
jgi:hypothetical protein